LGIAKGTISTLKRANINNLKELLELSKEDLKGVKGLGEKKIEELFVLLNAAGFELN
jgi:DNA-directed RNA polymerase alpha subunit